MENKNSANITLIVLIALLALIIGFLGGSSVFNYFQDKEPEVNNGEQNGNDESEKFTLKDAKELMNKYIDDSNGCFETYFGNLGDENEKNYFSLTKVEGQKGLSCDEVFGKDYKNYHDGRELCGSEMGNDFKPKVYSYQDVLAQKQTLFGDNSVLKKEEITGPFYARYYYNKPDSFVFLWVFGGAGGCNTVSNVLDVYDFEMENDNLYIYTKQVLVTDNSMSLREGDTLETNTTIFREKFTFKKQANGYYMTDVEKIK